MTRPPHITIIRGIPGSGKSTLAGVLKEHAWEFGGRIPVHVENDDFFTDQRGGYLYQPHLIKKAVEATHIRVEHELKAGRDVIVSNTFTQAWELHRIRELAQAYNATVQIIETWGPWDNIHNVPPEKVRAMRERFQPSSELYPMFLI